MPLTVKTILQDAVYDRESCRYRVHGDKVVHFVRVLGTCASMRDVSDKQTIVYMSDGTGTLALVFAPEKKETDSPKSVRARQKEEVEGDMLDEGKRATLQTMEYADTPEAQRYVPPDVYYEFTGYLTWMRRKRGMPRSHAHLCIRNARRVTDMNQVTHHMLECIHTYLQVTRGPLPRPPAASHEGPSFFMDDGDVCVDDDFF